MADNQQHFGAGGIGLGLLRFCLQHSDGNVGETNLEQYRRDPADYAWLKEALNNLEGDAEKMKKLVSKLTNNQNIDEIVYALEGLQYFVEDLDLANDLVKVNGIKPVVDLLTHENGDVRRWSAWIVASLTQNNHSTQLLLTTEHSILSVLSKIIVTETNDLAKDKQLYALSAVTSGSQPLMDQFVDSFNGIGLLIYIVKTSKLATTLFKAVWFLNKLLRSRPSNKKIVLNVINTSEFILDFIKIISDPNTEEDTSVRVVDTLLLLVTNEKEFSKQCKALGLDKTLLTILKQRSSGEGKGEGEGEDELKGLCKELLHTILIQSV